MLVVKSRRIVLLRSLFEKFVSLLNHLRRLQRPTLFSEEVGVTLIFAELRVNTDVTEALLYCPFCRGGKLLMELPIALQINGSQFGSTAR